MGFYDSIVKWRKNSVSKYLLSAYSKQVTFGVQVNLRHDLNPKELQYKRRDKTSMVEKRHPKICHLGVWIILS